MSDLWDNLKDSIPGNVVGAIILLVIGWIVARIVAAVVTRAVRQLHLDQQISRLMGRSSSTPSASGSDSASAAGKVAFYVVLLFVLIAVFDLLNMPLVTQPLNDLLSGVFGFLPRIIGAAILGVIAWVLATVLRTVVFGLCTGLNLDGRIRKLQGQPAIQGETPAARGLSELAFALVLLAFLPAILSVLQLNGILEPVQHLYDVFFGFIPNLIAAVAIVLIGWLVARFVGQLLTSILAAVGIDRFSERFGLAPSLGARRLSGTIGLLVYILILIPVIIAGLNALKLDSLTTPASNMLDTILQFIPRVVGAAVILIIAFVIGRFISDLIASLLRDTAYDSLLSRLGLGAALGSSEGGASATSFSLAKLTGQAIFVAFLWFAVIAALETLKLFTISALLVDLLGLAGHILLGLIIFVVGILLARVAGRLVRNVAGDQSGLVSAGAQAAIFVLFGAMALRQMGVANDIINLAFGILLGAVGIALAVAFGVGGRDVAGRQLARWLEAGQSDRGGATEP